MAGIALAAFFLAAGTWAWTRLPALHPVALWTASWSISSVLFALHLLPYQPLSTVTVVLVVLATVAFSAGVLGAERFAADRLARATAWWARLELGYPAAARAAWLSLALLAVGLFAFLAQAGRLVGWSGVFVTSADLRLAIGAGAMALTIKYVYAAAAAALLCALAASRAQVPLARRAWLAAAAAAALSTYFSTARSNIVLFGLASLVVYGLGSRVAVTRRKLVGATAAFAAFTIVVFLVGGAVIGKTIEDNALGRVQSPFTEHPALGTLGLPYQYASAPLAALDDQVAVSEPFGRAHGCALLAVGCRVLQAGGVAVTPEPAIRPFTGEPLPWNTYTALDLPLIDGGPGFVPIAFLVIGIACGVLWISARRRQALGLVTYGTAGAAIVYSPVQSNFLVPQAVGAIALGAALLLTGALWEKFAPRRAATAGEKRMTAGRPAP